MSLNDETEDLKEQVLLIKKQYQKWQEERSQTRKKTTINLLIDIYSYLKAMNGSHQQNRSSLLIVSLVAGFFLLITALFFLLSFLEFDGAIWATALGIVFAALFAIALAMILLLYTGLHIEFMHNQYLDDCIRQVKSSEIIELDTVFQAILCNYASVSFHEMDDFVPSPKALTKNQHDSARIILSIDYIGLYTFYNDTISDGLEVVDESTVTKI